MKHSKSDLKQMQSLPLRAKILMTQRRIRDWVDYWRGEVYVSFSGGKDSTVLKHIIDGMYNDVPAVFVNTGLEYPEIQQFVRELKAGKYDCFNSDVEIIWPEMRFDEVINLYGYPIISKEVSKAIYEARRSGIVNHCAPRDTRSYQRKFNPDSNYCRKYPSYCLQRYDYLLDAPFGISSKCCDAMKKKPAKDYEKRTARKPIVGTMADESQLRTTQWLKVGCNAFDSKRPRSAPMSFWTENDVLEYIVENDLPYASVYGEIVRDEKGYHTTGCYRTGCIFCMFGCHLEKAPNRFQRLKETHPRQYDYCMKSVAQGGLGLHEVLDYIGVDHGYEGELI